MARTIHICLDIRGALRWPNYRLRGMLRDDSGRLLTPREVRSALMDELSLGRRVLPIGDPCEGFSYDTGCPGHEREKIDAVIGHHTLSELRPSVEKP